MILIGHFKHGIKIASINHDEIFKALRRENGVKIKQQNLKKMLNPKNIVFIGSKNVIEQGLNNCKKLNFQGEIFAVNKNVINIDGVISVKNILDLPITPDIAFIAIKGENAVKVISELNNIGTYGCVVYAAGFSEIGNNKLHKDLISAAGDMALIGPNCYGFINYLDGIPLWPDHFGSTQVNSGVAIISQSGNLTFNITLNDRELPIAYIFDIGNQAVIDMADLISVLCEDPRVKAIGLHIEGLANVEKFINASKVAMQKSIPIVAFKTGISEKGSQLTMSHTSSLAGSDDLYDALFKRLNICRVQSLPAFLETLKLFSVTGKITGKNIGVLTVSGGESAIVADIVEKKGFELPDLSESQKTEIQLLMAGFEHVSNPLDYNMSLWGDEHKLATCFTSFMNNQFDVTLLVLDYLDKEGVNYDLWEITIKAFIRASKFKKTKAIVISVLPEGLPESFRKRLIENDITPLQGITDGFEAVKNVAEFYQYEKEILSAPSYLLLPEHTISEHNCVVLNEWEGKKELKTFGVNIPKGKIVTLSDEQLITGEMKAPFVLKILDSGIAHKSDVGGVRLYLQNEEEIKDAMLQMSVSLSNQIHYDGEMQFLLEEMVLGSVAELNIGIKRDEQFGLALIISLGGELVNLMNDSVPLLLPTNRDEILNALQSLKGFQLLTGFRGRQIGDIESVIDMAQLLAHYAETKRNLLLEMDVNPILVLPEGQGAVAVDSLIRTVVDIGKHTNDSDEDNVAM